MHSTSSLGGQPQAEGGLVQGPSSHSTSSLGGQPQAEGETRAGTFLPFDFVSGRTAASGGRDSCRDLPPIRLRLWEDSRKRSERLGRTVVGRR